MKPIFLYSRSFLARAARRWHRDERGQDLLEWTVGLPVFLALCAGIAFYFWYWWNATSAAVAIHDGTYLAAVRGGSAGEGYAEIQRQLQGLVGNFKSAYQVSLATDPRKSVSGQLSTASTFQLPFLGDWPFIIRARSFQRQENFYGGPPGPRGAAFWWW